MSQFNYRPSAFVPFRDQEVVARVRRIGPDDLTKHWNRDFRIQIVPDNDIEFLFVSDIFHRIVRAAEKGSKIVLIVPNPWSAYLKVAHLINRFQINCGHVYTFNMDEYADNEGNVAPETWPQGFMYAFKKYFFSAIHPDLRPPEKQVCGPTTENIQDYGRMIADLGGADACYSGPGWTGHLAFIEPDAPEFAAASLDDWKAMGPRIVTLSPFTIAQNSLHGSFGASGDLCAVPPKAASIGPAEVIGSRYRMEMHGISVGGTAISWQRLMSRLVLHGPVTPLVPSSILQTLKTDVFVSETLAQDIKPSERIGY